MFKKNRFSIAFKALRQLGFSQMGLYALYRLGLVSGHYRRADEHVQAVIGKNATPLKFNPVCNLPSPADLLSILGGSGKDRLLSQADEITAGRVRLFGGDPVPLRLSIDGPLHHWTAYEKDPSLYASLYVDFPDVKFLWEPARFGWAFTLGRAYHLSRDEGYAATFWNFSEQFLQANPPNLGPHWVSAQEVSLRLMAWIWCLQVFAGSLHSTSERQERLAQAIAEHAIRIPPTLVYARSQNNNHLLSEAVGLFTAGLALPDHPQASRWRSLGWKWLNRGFQSQIDAYGEYVQHSSNYQRLMLQLALWVKPMARQQDHYFPRRTSEALSIATHWLLSLLDPLSGSVPNLGANDGAYLFPLSDGVFADHRPVAQAAARSFMEYQLPAGPWDEMALWFGLPASDKYFQPPRYLGDSLYGRESWGSLRAVKYKSRPSHADQLHLDLWWRGLNIARDAGSYLYNVPPPWDNALTHTAVHNTVSVDGCEQMSRAGRFLYLDWASSGQKHPIEVNADILQSEVAWHAGYRRLGLRHERTVTIFNDEHWQVDDNLLFIKTNQPQRAFRLHWLLPDWEWGLDEKPNGVELRLRSPHGWVKLRLSSDLPQASFTLARAGELVYGKGPTAPTTGWFSPTYGQKFPALSCALEGMGQTDVKFYSRFHFPIS
jgi:hypothetical protein